MRETVVLTDEIIKQGENGNGGFNKRQLAVLGVDWPPRKGWKRRIVGLSYAAWRIERYLEFKGKPKPPKASIVDRYASIAKGDCTVNTQSSTPKKKKKRKKQKTSPKEEYSRKLLDPRWQRRRLEIFSRDNWRCVKCGCDTMELHVHHLKYERGKEPWEVPEESLETLCHDCHKASHGRRKEIRRKAS